MGAIGSVPVDDGARERRGVHAVNLDNVPLDVLQTTGSFLKRPETSGVCRRWAVGQGSVVNQVVQLPARHICCAYRRAPADGIA